MNMDSKRETAGVVALLRNGRRSWKWYANALSRSDSAIALLDQEHGLLSEPLLAEATAEVTQWESRRIQVLSRFDPEYPGALEDAPLPPPLLFLAGDLRPTDQHAVAVIGTRQPSAKGRHTARLVAQRLVNEGFTVASGLAAGIDTAAHEATLESGGRTLAVVGTGLDHCYPRANSGLQRRIVVDGAVISQFWPETRPSRGNFPLRNALMAGLTEATVIVEANAMSGTRIEARAALDMRRVVVLLDTLLEQQWARDLSEQPGVKVVRSAAHAVETLQHAIAQPALL
jgi:DNA processing protein